MVISWARKVRSFFRGSESGRSVRPTSRARVGAFEQLEERRLLDGLIHDLEPGPVEGVLIDGEAISLVNGEAYRTGSYVDKTHVSFQIYGPGKAVVTPILDTIHGPPVAYDVEIFGSTSETSFFVQDSGGVVKLRDVSVDGSIGLFHAAASDLVGNMSVLNGLGVVYIDDIYNDTLISQNPTFVPSFTVGSDPAIRDTSLVIDEINSLSMHVEGTIRSFIAGRVASVVDESGDGSVVIAAENIIRFSTAYDFSGGVLSAEEQIGTVNITGGIYNSGIYATDGIYQVTALVMHESKVAAGMAEGVGYLPTDDSQFTNKDAVIRSVWLYGMPPSPPTGGVGLALQSSFFVSSIVAWRIDSVYIGDVTPSSSIDFGVAANSVGLLSYLRPILPGEEGSKTDTDTKTDTGGHAGHGTETDHDDHVAADPDGLVRVTLNNLTRPDDPRLHTGITGFEVEIFAPGFIVPNYQETEVYRSENGVLDVHLTMANTTVSINDGQYTFQGQTYNGGFPGPTLRVKPGDILRITLTNEIGTPTNLHTHGLHVSPLGNSDNVFISLPTDSTMEYMYQIPADHPEGLYWYHPHKHHLVDSQVVMGLSGLLIVEREGGGTPELSKLVHRYMSVRNVPLDDGVINTNQAPADQLFIVNNQINPIIGIAPGETQVWNIGNIGNDGWYDLYLEGQDLQIVGIDGNPMTSVMSVDSFQLAPGQRLSILVTGNEVGEFQLKTKGFDQGFQVWPEATLATVAVQGKQQEPFVVPATLNPYNNFYTDLRDVEINQTVNLEFQIKVGPLGVTFPINGKVYDENRIDVIALLNTVDEWVLTNTSTDWHPFHIHVNPFQVIEIDGVPVDYGTFQDVVGIPPIHSDGTPGSVKIRMKYTDFVGEYVFHCHILVHEDGGMMGNILVTQPGYQDYPGTGGGGHDGGHSAASSTAINTLQNADGVSLTLVE